MSDRDMADWTSRYFYVAVWMYLYIFKSKKKKTKNTKPSYLCLHNIFSLESRQ